MIVDGVASKSAFEQIQGPLRMAAHFPGEAGVRETVLHDDLAGGPDLAAYIRDTRQ